MVIELLRNKILVLMFVSIMSVMGVTSIINNSVIVKGNGFEETFEMGYFENIEKEFKKEWNLVVDYFLVDFGFIDDVKNLNGQSVSQSKVLDGFWGLVKS